MVSVFTSAYVVSSSHGDVGSSKDGVNTAKTMSLSLLEVEPVIEVSLPFCLMCPRGQPDRLSQPQTGEPLFLLWLFGHPETSRTRTLMSSRVVWYGMMSDVLAWCRECQQRVSGKSLLTAQHHHPTHSNPKIQPPSSWPGGPGFQWQTMSSAACSARHKSWPVFKKLSICLPVIKFRWRS